MNADSVTDKPPLVCRRTGSSQNFASLLSRSA
jgi:hypothetical protein